MNEYILWVFLLSIWNIVLFYGKEYGVSVILFIIPLCYFKYYFMKKNNRINNKKGLLLFIPICLLSLCYLLFNVELLNILNFFVIASLFIFMYIFTINPTYELKRIFSNFINLLFKPFNYVSRLFRVTKYKLFSKVKVSDKVKKVSKALLIVVPISLIIIGLLSSADMEFSILFSNIFDKALDFIWDVLFNDLFGKIICVILVYFIIGCTCMYLLYDYKKEEVKEKKTPKNMFTIKSLITVLNIIYLLFDYIQIKSLFLFKVSNGISYAQYARRGFFELMVVSLINLTIILISKKNEDKKNVKETNYVKVMNIIMVLLTIIILASSLMRMHMYESAFGYTTLRILVFASIITESILMIPTVMYIFNSEVNIIEKYFVIIICSYLIVNFMNIDYIVAKRNIAKAEYHASSLNYKNLDLDYLTNYHTDNVPVLIDFYKKIENEEVHKELEDYLLTLHKFLEEDNNIFEFNYSKYKAHNQIHYLFYD